MEALKVLAAVALLTAMGMVHSPSRAETLGTSHCTAQTSITGVIGPATVDWIQRVQRQAIAEDCGSILLLMNTPGGSLESTRLIVERILNSPIPYLCLVSPSGGHAGSAGAIILQACHVNGALRGTNLGAATPVGMGQDLPKDLRRKILNDTRSWIDSLTDLRHRNRQFGEDIVLQAKAVTAEEAHKLGAIDFSGESEKEFLTFASQQKVKLAAREDFAAVSTGTLRSFEFDTRYQILSLLTDPEFAYMMLLASLALLYFEITHSGLIFPGVAGGVGLVIALVALQKLDVEWGGLLLVFLGVGLLIAEMFLPTLGLVGLAGLGALALGSVFLFDPVRSFGYHLPYGLITAVVLVFAMVLVGVSWLFLKTTRVKKRGGFEDLMGLVAVVIDINASKTSGRVEFQGEIWNFASEAPLAVNDRVLIKGHKGLVLQVEKEA